MMISRLLTSSVPRHLLRPARVSSLSAPVRHASSRGGGDLSKDRQFILKVFAGAAGMYAGINALFYYTFKKNEFVTRIATEIRIRENINETYLYFGGSIAATAASAAAIFRSPSAKYMVMRHPWIVLGVSIAAMIGSGMVARSMPYQAAPSAKQLAWLVHCSFMGATVAPICLMGGALVTKAACYTAVILGGFSTLPACLDKIVGGILRNDNKSTSLDKIVGGILRNDNKLEIFGTAYAGEFIITVSSIVGTMFLPTGLQSVAIYGCMVVFGSLLLLDTHNITDRAVHHPVGEGAPPFDPMNACMDIYVDTVFFRSIRRAMKGSNGVSGDEQ